LRARKGASFSLRSKENSGYPKVGRELPPAALALIFPLIYPGVFCMNNSRAGRIRFGEAAEIHAAKGNS
jgi:hypothetical protein